MSDTEKKRGLVGAVRGRSLRMENLAAAEKHGKREDHSGPARQVRDADPLVNGTLDLRDALAVHMRGVKTQGKMACLHCIVQFPTKLIDGTDPERQQWMLDHATWFVNEYYGGDAVFAARLDRDEKGRHTVDVFAMPKYDYLYKDGRTAKKASISKFSRQRAEERFGKGKNHPRYQGRALQDAWFEYMRNEMRLDVQQPTRKKPWVKDRLEPEEWGFQQDRKRHEREKQEFEREKQEFECEKQAFQSEKQAFFEKAWKRQATLDKREVAVNAGERRLRRDRKAAAEANLDAEAIISAARDKAELILDEARPIKARAEAELDEALAYSSGLEKEAERLGDLQMAERLRKGREAMKPKQRKAPGKQMVRGR